MKWHYTRNELDGIYNRIVASAYKAFCKGEIEKSLKRIQLAGFFEYNINIFYSDKRLSSLMRLISKKIHKEKENFIPNANLILFYDSYGLDNKGLSQQYLDAILFNKKVELIYVVENSLTDRSRNIKGFLTGRGVEIIELGNVEILDKVKTLYDIIIRYKPAKSFFHLTPSTPIPIVGFYPFPQIVKYQINITDHAFWLGGGDFFDYSFEFRSYGCQVSIEKRFFTKNQIRLLPYYPWIEKEVFEGFPVDVRGKIVLFSGSSIYKIIDENDTFFHIIRQLLEDNPNTIMFFAGDGDSSHLKKLINEYKLNGRFFVIGVRHDISEVFKHCDIYIGTYPLAGGLMTQYAAMHGKPILAYKTHVIEELLTCSNNNFTYVFDNIDQLKEEARKLINDRDYRNTKGAEFKKMVSNQELFRESFLGLMKNGFASQYSNVKIDYNQICNNYVDLLNNNCNTNFEKRIANTSLLLINWKMFVNIFLDIFYSMFKSRYK